MKRIIALALSLTLLLGLAAGCGQESGSETAMGRYIEDVYKRQLHRRRAGPAHRTAL